MQRSLPHMGQVIRAARAYMAMSQIEFAERLGVTQSTVSRIESGEMHYPTVTLEHVLKALELTSASPFFRDIAQFREAVIDAAIAAGAGADQVHKPRMTSGSISSARTGRER